MSYPGGYFAGLREKYSDAEIAKQINVTSNTSRVETGCCGGVEKIMQYPYCLIQRNESNFYHSEMNKIAKIVFDMGSPFSLNGFAIKSLLSGCAWLKSYSFKGSNDGENWNLIKYFKVGFILLLFCNTFSRFYWFTI